MISPLAHIHPNAKIGSNVEVGPFAIIEENVTISDDCHIMPHAVIMKGTRLGKGCKVFPGAVLGAIPQDLKFDGEETTVEVGDNTTIRECVTINRGTIDKWKTVVGSDCLLMAYCHIAHDCILGDHVIIANSVQLAGHVEIGDYAFVGGMAAAIQFSKVGAHTYIAGGTEIIKDIPPYIKAGRSPLSYVGVNSIGLQRRGFSPEKINSIHEIYRNIYMRGMNTSQAMDYIEENLPDTDEKREILEFIKNSKRGILKISSKEIVDEN